MGWCAGLVEWLAESGCLEKSGKSNPRSSGRRAHSRRTSQRLCLAIEVFLSTVMSKDELDVFKAKTPMKYPIKQYANILEEMQAERLM